MAATSPIVQAANLRAVAAQDAAKYGLGRWFVRQIQQESNFDPNAHSSAGAEGIAQFIPSTAHGVGLRNPYDPVASLDAAARFDSQLLHEYGSPARALSAYNSGRPDAYQDPHFAGGQTFNYVRSILGGGGGGAASSAAPPAAVTRTMAASTPPRRSGASPIVAALRLLGFNAPSGLGMAAAPGLAAPEAKVAPLHFQAGSSGPLELAAVPGQLDTRAGIAVDRSILPTVEQLAQRFGVKVNSGYRSPTHNAAVGGAENSDHLRGDAVDFAGPTGALMQLYRFAQGRFPYVEPMAQAKDHVHISFKR